MSSNDIYTILSSKPHNPHHLKRYIKFINLCFINSTYHEQKVERHHICPKAKDLFPEYISFKLHPWNKINLTLKQHYIAHLILWKTFKGSQAKAFKMMCDRGNFKNSRSYILAKELHSNSMRGELNNNYDGIQAKLSWEKASPTRRKMQSELMSQINKLTKTKPKEFKEYECMYCRDTFYKEEHCHHLRISEPFCSQSCSLKFNRKLNGKTRKGKKIHRISPAWNKGLKSPNTSGLNNVMNRPECKAKLKEISTGRKQYIRADGSKTWKYKDDSGWYIRQSENKIYVG